LATGECVAIDDAVQIDDDDTFELSGRSVDMLKVAGKRASMADLSLRLNRIDGVDDGVFVRQMDRTLGVDRLIALVVAPTLSAQEIRANLARQVDPVFLPRRILRVEALPRSETGKLSKRLVEALIERLTN
jgi:acyl-coenzyme A synthetase/AMP-(fatty) acid ligase